MKFLVALLALVCLVLAQKSLAGPVNMEGNSAESVDSRIGISTFNCVAHCLQPTVQEVESDDIESRGIIGNYATLFRCIKECGNKSK